MQSSHPAARLGESGKAETIHIIQGGLMRVLVVNAGSSSLKCQLIETDGKASMMKCLAEKVGSDDAYMNVSFYPDFDKTRYNVAACASSRSWRSCSTR